VNLAKFRITPLELNELSEINSMWTDIFVCIFEISKMEEFENGKKSFLFAIFSPTIIYTSPSKEINCEAW
jgi:hypothetical protein